MNIDETISELKAERQKLNETIEISKARVKTLDKQIKELEKLSEKAKGILSQSE